MGNPLPAAPRAQNSAETKSQIRRAPAAHGNPAAKSKTQSETEMHILLLNEYYPPDTSATAKMAAQVAEALAHRHHVTVVAGRPSYDPDEFYSWSLLRKEIRNGVSVEH